MFADKLDVQTWLASDKIQVDDALILKPNIDAARIIKSQLATVFSVAVIQSWADPDVTPGIIRSIAGRLVAAYIYRTIYSEEGAEATYATELYTEAMTMLAQIVAGTLVVTDDDGDPIDVTGATVLSFWPDNTTEPKFTMDSTFA